jgi:general secretion pathway protein A
LDDDIIAAVLTNPRLAPLDFFNMIALELGMNGPFSTKGQFLAAFNQFTAQCRKRKKTILLVVDEAHSLTMEMLEELRLLGNLDDSSPKILNIFLVGQPEMAGLLRKARSSGLLQRLRRFYLLSPLNPEDTAFYIRHRISTAGGDPQLFSDRALDAIYKITKGNPRLINTLCDAALLLAFTKGAPQLTRQLVLEAAKEEASLNWDPEEEPRVEPDFLEQEKTRETEPEPEKYKALDLQQPARQSSQGGAEKVTANQIRTRKEEAYPARDYREPDPEYMPEPLRPYGEELFQKEEPTPRPAPKKRRIFPKSAKKSSGKTRVHRAKKASTAQKSSGLIKRAVVLLVILLFISGSFVFYKIGGVSYLRYKWKVWTSDQPPGVFVPDEAPEKPETPKSKQPEGVGDWGPIVEAPPNASAKGGLNG